MKEVIFKMRFYFKNVSDFSKKIDDFREKGLVPKNNKVDLIKFGNKVFSSNYFKQMPNETQTQIKVIIEAIIKENSAAKNKIIVFINNKEKMEVAEFEKIMIKILDLKIPEEKMKDRKFVLNAIHNELKKFDLTLNELLHLYILNEEFFNYCIEDIEYLKEEMEDENVEFKTFKIGILDNEFDKEDEKQTREFLQAFLENNLDANVEFKKQKNKYFLFEVSLLLYYDNDYISFIKENGKNLNKHTNGRFVLKVSK